MKKQVVIDALAREGLAADGARVTPEIEAGLATVRLRFDRVALRFVRDVQSALRAVVPDGKMLVFTITAPIRQASRTAVTLEDNVRGALARRYARFDDLKSTINGNQIRVRLLKGRSSTTGVLGFVHNPETDPEVLFGTVQSLLRGTSITQRATGSRRPKGES